jgi:hypothetical protein
MRRAVTSSCTLPHWLTIVWRPSSGSGPLRDSRHSAGSGRPGAPPSSPGGIRAPRPARLPPTTCAVSRDRIHRHGRRALATCRWTRTPAPRQSQMTLPTAGERVQVSAHQHRKLRRSPGGPVMPGAICLISAGAADAVGRSAQPVNGFLPDDGRARRFRDGARAVLLPGRIRLRQHRRRAHHLGGRPDRRARLARAQRPRLRQGNDRATVPRGPAGLASQPLHMLSSLAGHPFVLWPNEWRFSVLR